MNLFGNLSSISPLPLQDGIREFVQIYMPARNYALRTRKEYEDDMRDLAAFISEKNIASWTVVGLRDLQQYLAELDRRSLRASSRNRKAYAIKTFFGFLTQMGLVRENPAEELIPPTVSRKEPRFLRESEYQALRAQITDTRDIAIVEVFLQTGITITELARLTVRDVQLPHIISQDSDEVGLVTVRRRRQREEVLPINWRAAEALKNWLSERREMLRLVAPIDALFVSRVRKPLTIRAIRNMVKKYTEQAGIFEASVRTLRHTMATHYLAKGGDLKSVQEMLGHQSMQTTAIYLKTARRVKEQMVQKLAL